VLSEIDFGVGVRMRCEVRVGVALGMELPLAFFGGDWSVVVSSEACLFRTVGTSPVQLGRVGCLRLGGIVLDCGESKKLRMPSGSVFAMRSNARKTSKAGRVVVAAIGIEKDGAKRERKWKLEKQVEIRSAGTVTRCYCNLEVKVDNNM